MDEIEMEQSVVALNLRPDHSRRGPPGSRTGIRHREAANSRGDRLPLGRREPPDAIQRGRSLRPLVEPNAARAT